MAEINIQNVWKVYQDKQREVVAVRDFNLDIPDGEFVAFLGPSGCGKTSTLRMIAGLEEISRGDIVIGGQRVNDLEPNERNIAMAFETYALYPHLRVYDNIAFCLKARRMSGRSIDDQVNNIAGELGIEDLLDARPSELSGGQQQLVSVARALVRNPAVFLLDEPLSHLDATRRVSVRTRIKEVVNDLGATTIYVTHDQFEATALADRIVVMNFAEMQQVGSADDLLDRPVNLFVAGFVGEPAINLLECRVRSENGTTYLDQSVEGGVRLALPDQHAAAVAAANIDAVTVGIRPHNLSLANGHNSAIQLGGMVEFFEFLGEVGNVHVVLNPDTTLVAVTEPDLTLGEGESIMLDVDTNHLHLFDTKGGAALKV